MLYRDYERFFKFPEKLAICYNWSMIAFYSDMVAKVYGEKCHYCDQEALYNDMVGYKLIGVCKTHLNYHTS